MNGKDEGTGGQDKPARNNRAEGRAEHNNLAEGRAHRNSPADGHAECNNPTEGRAQRNNPTDGRAGVRRLRWTGKSMRCWRKFLACTAGGA